MKFQTKTLSNIFLLPFILCLIQFCFLFVALFKSGFFFETEVLLINIFLIIIWGVLLLYSAIIYKNIKINIIQILIFFICVCISLYVIKVSWFSGYLSIESIQKLFKGDQYLFIDTLYHSSIAESIVTNGYPSIQQNLSSFLGYHALSHYLIAGLSILLDLPCFIIYNYVYPLITFPLFLFLIQKIILITRSYISDEKNVSLNLLDYFFLFFVVSCFFSKKINDNLGYGFNVFLQSESYCVSLIFIFIYICIINSGYKIIKNFDLFNKLIFIPLFILLLSYSKISTGFVFLIGISYWLFRQKKSIKNILCILVYGIIFCCYYYIIGHVGVIKKTFVTPQNSSIIELFHYVKHYTKNYYYAILHYILLFLPIVLICLFSGIKNYFFNFRKENNKIGLLIEMSFILLITSFLPGLLLKIDGGSALYFVSPVYLFIFVIFIGTNTHAKIFQIKKINDYNISFYFKNFKVVSINLLTILICILLYSTLREINIHQILKKSLYARLDKDTIMLESRNQKILNMFKSSSLILDNNYNLFNEIRNITKNEKKNYCIYIVDENNFLNTYDNLNSPYKSTLYKMKPLFAITAYLGIPIINSIYIENEIFYRCDGSRLGKIEDFAGYSLPPAVCGNKITSENIKDVAQKLGKKYIIVLENNDFDLIVGD